MTIGSARAFPSHLLSAVLFVSAGTLAFEILLVRIFAIEYFHHFAYLVVGVAMIGFGASGTLMAFASRAEHDRLARLFEWSAALTPLTLLISPILVHRIALDPTQLAWDPRQWLLLGLVELILALPFLAGGLVILLALTLERRRPGLVYGASFIGAAVGAAAVIGILLIWTPARALAVPATIAALGGIGVALSAPPRSIARAARWSLLAITILAVIVPPWSLAISPYKSLDQVSAYPEARRPFEAASPIGWVVEIDAAAFRYGPGLSLAYEGAFPRQSALFVDGDLAGAVSRWRDEGERLIFTDHLPTSSPYVLRAPDRTLIIGAGEGLEVATARAHGSRSITAVELHPAIAQRQESSSGSLRWVGRTAPSTRAGEQPTEPRVRAEATTRWVVSDARGYLERTRERFDLVALGPGGAFGAAAGTHTLNEDFLHTTDAYLLYLRRLTSDGMLSVTRWLTGPPREPVRVILTVCEALRGIGSNPVERSLIVVRSWATVTVLAKPSGFSREAIGRLRSWADEREFDIDWYPSIEEPPADGYHNLEDPVLYEAARAGMRGASASASFAAGYAWLVAPRSDAKPYTHNFLRLASLGTLFEPDRAAWIPFAEWGLIALVATLALSFPLAALFLLGPMLLRGTRGRVEDRGSLLGYFGVVGFAYLAAEIAAIQQLSLLLGHPVYAVIATLTVILLGSGVGSALSDRFTPLRARAALGWLVALLLIEAALLLPTIRAALSAPLPVRAMIALVALLPPSILMGSPFPSGLRVFARGEPKRVAWAWAANGFATVVASPLSALIALQLGSGLLFASAAAAYGCAFILIAGARRASLEKDGRRC